MKGLTVQPNLSYVTFQGNSEIGSHKTCGHLIKVVTKVGLTACCSLTILEKLAK